MRREIGQKPRSALCRPIFRPFRRLQRRGEDETPVRTDCCARGVRTYTYVYRVFATTGGGLCRRDRINVNLSFGVRARASACIKNKVDFFHDRQSILSNCSDGCTIVRYDNCMMDRRKARVMFAV